MRKLIFITLFFNSFFFKAQIISTIAGNGTAGYNGDGGQATDAELNDPRGVVSDTLGNIYIADTYNNVIRKINNTGIITTIIGNGTAGYSGDGGQATAAQLNYPQHILVDALGNIYISDTQNNRVRKVNNFGIITTIAGNGVDAGTGYSNYSGDGGQATDAGISVPLGLAMDALGNLYISDSYNFRIRKVDVSGIITTVAGDGYGAPNSGGFSGDGGQATNAELQNPSDVVFDSNSNLYIADFNNDRIRKVNNYGIINTLILTSSIGLAIDKANNLYTVDGSGNSRVQKVDAFGNISNVAGIGTPGYAGDGGLASLAILYQPSTVNIDTKGNIYIADSYNHRIRKVTPPLTVSVSSSPAVCVGVSDTLTASGADTYIWTPATGLSTTTGSMVIANPTVTTTYTVVGTKGDSMGLNTSIIMINPKPAITIGTFTSNCAPICITFTSTSAPAAATYNWNFDNGNTSTQASSTQCFTLTNTYTVQLTITDMDGCINTDSTIFTTENCTGIEEISTKNEISLYPNPSNGNINIISTDNMDELKVTDLLGQTLYEAKPMAPAATLTLENAGVYFVTLTCGKEVSTQKIIISK